MWWPLLVALAGAAVTPPSVSADSQPPSEHTIVYYNARMALREGDASEATRLWLLRNALESQTGRVSPYDADFRSVTWAALGDLGLCQDGLSKDEDGAGLWPLALHNQVVRTMGRRMLGQRTSVFNAFEVGQQARTVSVSDVLSARELQALELSRSVCLRPKVMVLASGEKLRAQLSDRQVAARLLRQLLERARGTLARDRVRGRAVIEARLFDLDLQLTALAAREARYQTRDVGNLARQLGLNRTAVGALRAERPSSTLDPNSAAAGVLRRSVGWSAVEWMALSPDRRLYLYQAARNFLGETPALDALGVEILDAVIAEGDGAGASAWIGLLGGSGGPERFWAGERGQRLLALDDASGVGERAVIAAHRGVDQLSRGAMPEALRSMAFARSHAAESQASAALQGLSLRWLSYVASQFEVTEDLLVTLQELVPRRDYGVLLEDLMWSAAFHADLRSFDTGLSNQAGRGALERRLGLLRPLAAGDAKRFLAQVRVGLADSPGETLRFLDQLEQRLELEDGDVRGAMLPTLAGLRRLLEPFAREDGSQGRAAAALIERALAIEQGLSGLPAQASARDQARALAPGGTVFAGSVRLAPADPLPWPFQATDTAAPSVFLPISLVPVEWRDPAGALVFGWSIRG